MNFDYTPKMQEYRERVAAFMDKHIYPNEQRFHEEVNTGDRWEPTKIVEELKPLARAEGLWNLFLPDSPHGAGLTNLEYAPLAEMMGRVEWARKSSIARRPIPATWKRSSATAPTSKRRNG